MSKSSYRTGGDVATARLVSLSLDPHLITDSECLEIPLIRSLHRARYAPWAILHYHVGILC